MAVYANDGTIDGTKGICDFCDCDRNSGKPRSGYDALVQWVGQRWEARDLHLTFYNGDTHGIKLWSCGVGCQIRVSMPQLNEL